MKFYCGNGVKSSSPSHFPPASVKIYLNSLLCIVCAYVLKSFQSCSTVCKPMTPQPTEFSRQEYWNGLPWSHPVDLPDPGIKSAWVGSLPLVPPGKPSEYCTGQQSKGGYKMKLLLKKMCQKQCTARSSFLTFALYSTGLPWGIASSHLYLLICL